MTFINDDIRSTILTSGDVFSSLNSIIFKFVDAKVEM